MAEPDYDMIHNPPPPGHRLWKSWKAGQAAKPQPLDASTLQPLGGPEVSETTAEEPEESDEPEPVDNEDLDEDEDDDADEISDDDEDEEEDEEEPEEDEDDLFEDEEKDSRANKRIRQLIKKNKELEREVRSRSAPTQQTDDTMTQLLAEVRKMTAPAQTEQRVGPPRHEDVVAIMQQQGLDPTDENNRAAYNNIMLAMHVDANQKRVDNVAQLLARIEHDRQMKEFDGALTGALAERLDKYSKVPLETKRRMFEYAKYVAVQRRLDAESAAKAAATVFRGELKQLKRKGQERSNRDSHVHDLVSTPGRGGRRTTGSQPSGRTAKFRSFDEYEEAVFTPRDQPKARRRRSKR